FWSRQNCCRKGGRWPDHLFPLQCSFDAGEKFVAHLVVSTLDSAHVALADLQTLGELGLRQPRLDAHHPNRVLNVLIEDERNEISALSGRPGRDPGHGYIVIVPNDDESRSAVVENDLRLASHRYTSLRWLMRTTCITPAESSLLNLTR